LKGHSGHEFNERADSLANAEAIRAAEAVGWDGPIHWSVRESASRNTRPSASIGEETRFFRVYPDYHTGERCGAGGFQIESIIEDSGDEETDVSRKVDQGLHFHSFSDLQSYLADTFGLAEAKIEVDLEDARGLWDADIGIDFEDCSKGAS
jgi:hypothetical protein